MFLEPRGHFLWKWPFHNGHARFWAELKTRKINIFCSYLFDTFVYFFINASVKFLDGFLEPCYDPTVSIKKVINRYLRAKTSSPVHSLASNSNSNTMILKMKKFKCQFTPIKQNLSNDFFKRQLSKTIATEYLPCSLLSSSPQINESSPTSGFHISL